MKRFLLIPVLMLALGSCGSHKNISVPAEEKPLLTDGYIDIHPDSKTNAIQHVEMKDTEKVSYRNFQDYLQSHVSGVDITASGGIVIRGMGTFNGSSDPLVLMDGTEIQDLDSINPYDIHSIDVTRRKSRQKGRQEKIRAGNFVGLRKIATFAVHFWMWRSW